MTARLFTPWVLGAALIAGGIAYLVITLTGYGGPLEPVLSGLIGLLALPYLGRWLAGRDQWWALIAAYVFFALAVPVLALALLPPVWQLFAAIVLVEIAIGFTAAAFLEPDVAWAGIVAYAAGALAGVLLLSLVLADTVLLGGIAMVLASVPLWVLFARDRTRLWALVPASVVSLLALVLVVAAGVAAVSRAGFLLVLVNGVLAVIFLVLFVVVRRFDWALWLAFATGAGAILAIFFPSGGPGFALFALTMGSYIIVWQIRSTRQSRAAAQPAQPNQVGVGKGAAAKKPRKKPQPKQPPSAPPAGKAPVTGFRPLEIDEDDEP